MGVLGNKRPSTPAFTLAKPISTSPQRLSTTASGTVYDHIDHKAEQKFGEMLLEKNPDEVTTQSSTRDVLEESQSEEKDTDMMAGVKADLV